MFQNMFRWKPAEMFRFNISEMKLLQDLVLLSLNIKK